jgi:hypothetical protein
MQRAFLLSDISPDRPPNGPALRGRSHVTGEMMPLNSSHLTSVPWPVLLIGAWLIAIMTSALLFHAIAKAAINKTDASNLPQVLAALAPLLGGMMRLLTRIPGRPSFPTDPASTQTQGIGQQAQETSTMEAGQ